MAKCHVCHEQLSLPNDCNYCGEYYCSAHRLPENHQCPSLDHVRTLGPEFRRDVAVIDGDSGDRDSGLSRVLIGAGVVLVAITLVAVVLLV